MRFNRHRLSLTVSAAALALAMGAGGALADVVADAKAHVQERTSAQTTWDGPTSSPKPEPGKKVAYLSTDEQNDASREWGQAIKEAGEKVGWEVTIIDGRGSPVSWIQGMNQAIALGVDGIVTTADVASLQDPVKQALAKGITLVGIHGTAFPGPDKELGLFYNIQQDPRDIGAAQADWIIANSDGKARVVVTTHCEYAIACAKATATKERLEQCDTCEVLEFHNSPIVEASQRMPQAITSWVQQYGTPLYVTAVADYTLDFMVPALRTGGVDPKDVILVGADGNQSAYERIRAGDQYQLVTASEPYKMQGYQAIDELNRAFHGEPPSGWVQKPFLVTPTNVDIEGGDKNTFIPSNNYQEHYAEIWGVK